MSLPGLKKSLRKWLLKIQTNFWSDHLLIKWIVFMRCLGAFVGDGEDPDGDEGHEYGDNGGIDIGEDGFGIP